MVTLSAFFGAISGLVGALISSTGTGFSTGPLVVLIASAIVLFSMFFAPNRGLFWGWVRQQRSRCQLRLENVLTDLFLLANQHGNLLHPHSIQALRAMNAGGDWVQTSLLRLKELEMVSQLDEHNWALTPKGVETARQIVNIYHPTGEGQ
jgi:manganese/zinc/iron transport system permease protein